MNLADRVRKMRELKGYRQNQVARAMGISQQSYYAFERNADLAKVKTLKRFCAMLEIELIFLLAEDIPVTYENLNRYGTRKYNDVINDYEKYKRIFSDSNLLTHIVNGLNYQTITPVIV